MSRNVPPRPLNRFILLGRSLTLKPRDLMEVQTVLEIKEDLDEHFSRIGMYVEEYFSDRHSHDAYGSLIGKEEEGVPLENRPTYYVRDVLAKLRELGKLPVPPAPGCSDPPERVHFSVIREAFESVEDDGKQLVGESVAVAGDS